MFIKQILKHLIVWSSSVLKHWICWSKHILKHSNKCTLTLDCLINHLLKRWVVWSNNVLKYWMCLSIKFLITRLFDQAVYLNTGCFWSKHILKHFSKSTLTLDCLINNLLKHWIVWSNNVLKHWKCLSTIYLNTWLFDQEVLLEPTTTNFGAPWL